jgi:hypothetical protein
LTGEPQLRDDHPDAQRETLLRLLSLASHPAQRLARKDDVGLSDEHIVALALFDDVARRGQRDLIDHHLERSRLLSPPHPPFQVLASDVHHAQKMMGMKGNLVKNALIHPFRSDI